MKRGHSIFTAILFISIISGGCEKLVVPEYGGSNTEKPDTNKGDNNLTDSSGKEDEKDKNDSSVSDNNGNEDNKSDIEDIENNNPEEDSPNENEDDKYTDILHDGYEDTPYWASDLATGYVGKYIIEKGVSISNSWITGYIVGYINGTKLTEKSAVFAAGTKETNILIADKPSETDYTMCVPIQLSSGTSYKEARKALNLKDNPNNIGKKVKLSGFAEKYMGCAGIKNTRKYEFIE